MIHGVGIKWFSKQNFPLKLVKEKTGSECKSSQCQKTNFEKPSESLKNLLLKTALKVIRKSECFEDNIKKCSWVETFIEDCLLETFL